MGRGAVSGGVGLVYPQGDLSLLLITKHKVNSRE